MQVRKMSNQGQRMRRNGSPSTSKQGPIKAVKAFSLKQGNGTTRNSSSTSPRDSHKLWSQKSHENRPSPERKSPAGLQSQSPNFNQKDKGVGPWHSPIQGKWRASSVDTVVPSYLTGQWPKDINSYHHYQSDGVFMCDKSTQTVEWYNRTEKKKKGHRRSASLGQGDQLKLQVIKQHLQKSKEGSKHSDNKQRSSPVPGNHSALSMTAPPALCAQQTKAILISRHIPKQNMNRYQRNSVEGLNTEIEKLVSSVSVLNVSAYDGEEIDHVFRDIPDGHRAPVPDVTRSSSTRSIDTQTPSGQLDLTATSLMRPASISPAIPPRPGSIDIQQQSRSRSDSSDSKSSKGDAETSPEPSSYPSPKFDKCPFVREPPDGCEKVTVVEESRRPQIKEPMLFSPVKPNQFEFKPSQGSAFCPLIKSYLGEKEFPITYNGPSPGLSSGIDG